MLVFSVMPYRNKYQYHLIESRIWKKNEGKYAKTLAKIQVTAIFFKQDMRRNVLPKFKRDLFGDATLVPVQMGTNMAPGNQQKASVTEFYYETVNLSLEELKNIKIILFLINELFN